MTEGVCSVYEPDMLLNLKSENACASKYNVMLVEATQPAQQFMTPNEKDIQVQVSAFVGVCESTAQICRSESGMMGFDAVMLFDT